MQDERYEFTRHEGRPQDELPQERATLSVVKDYRRMYERHQELVQTISSLRRENGDLRLRLALTEEARKNVRFDVDRRGRPRDVMRSVKNIARQVEQQRVSAVGQVKMLVGEVVAFDELSEDHRERLLARLGKVEDKLGRMAQNIANIIGKMEDKLGKMEDEGDGVRK